MVGTSSSPINYLTRANPEKLRLIQGDGETLSELLSLISEYEGTFSTSGAPIHVVLA
jgi:hypothetical protein